MFLRMDQLTFARRPPPELPVDRFDAVDARGATGPAIPTAGDMDLGGGPGSAPGPGERLCMERCMMSASSKTRSDGLARGDGHAVAEPDRGESRP